MDLLNYHLTKNENVEEQYLRLSCLAYCDKCPIRAQICDSIGSHPILKTIVAPVETSSTWLGKKLAFLKNLNDNT